MKNFEGLKAYKEGYKNGYLDALKEMGNCNEIINIIIPGDEIVYEEDVRAVILDYVDEEYIMVLNELGCVEKLNVRDIDDITGIHLHSFDNLYEDLQS